MSLPSQEPKDGLSKEEFSNPTYQYDAYGSTRDDDNYPAHPNYAYTQGPTPTPTANYYNVNSTSHIERPMQAQPHPGES